MRRAVEVTKAGVADGVTAKSGGIVVKNVAGYDLARLLTGAFGSLGIIVNATFKLAPLSEPLIYPTPKLCC